MLRFSKLCLIKLSVGGVMVSMVAFQAVDPGSIPGRRNFFLDIYLLLLNSRENNIIKVICTQIIKTQSKSILKYLFVNFSYHILKINIVESTTDPYEAKLS